MLLKFSCPESISIYINHEGENTLRFLINIGRIGGGGHLYLHFYHKTNFTPTGL